MAKVIITTSLKEDIFRKFKQDSKKIFLLMQSLETQHKKGKSIGNVAGIIIKEIKFEKFRFYCITDSHIIKFGTEEELGTVLIKFIAMSEKKDQKKVINKIKETLQSMGFEKF